MKNFRIGLLILCFPFFAGCLAVAAGGAGTGAGYTLANIVSKTFNHPMDKVGNAVEKTFKTMGITLVDNSMDKDDRVVKGSTKELEIIVTLEKVTDKTTKMLVNAKKGMILKDKATANEILNQTGQILG